MGTIEELRRAYLEAVERLIASSPQQEQNRAYYESWAQRARLGKTLRRVYTQTRYMDIPPHEEVLVGPEERVGSNILVAV